jgi:hypothetical protein
MTTRLEKAEKAYKLEQYKADIKRLKKAHEHLDIAASVLGMPFNDSGNEKVARATFEALTSAMRAVAEVANTI